MPSSRGPKTRWPCCWTRGPTQDNFGNGSPLLSAIQTQHKDIAALLLDKGADPTLKTPWGETMLKAAQNYGGGPEMVALIQKHMPAGAAGAADAPKPEK